jgi:hypothetical protein
LLTSALLTGIYTANVPTVFADSRLIKQGTKQTANCDTVGADSPVSNSCNQSAANNVNNGVPKTAVTPETTGTLLVKFVCNIPICATSRSVIIISSANAQPDILTFTVSGSQLVTLDPGTFAILVISVIGQDRSGDCDIGTIKAGQHLTCTIIAAP